MTREIDVRESGPVLDVAFCRPPDNLFTLQMCNTLLSILRVPPPGIRILRLRGTPEVFCLGRERLGNTLDELSHEARILGDVNRALRETSLLTVAEVTGDAAGFGVGLMALCDIAVSFRAAKFWFPEVRLGLAPALVLSWLPGIVGSRQAFRLTASGEAISGDEALRLNLITSVVDTPDELSAAVEAVITMLSNHPPHVYSEIRHIMRTMDGLDFGAATEVGVDRLTLASLARLKR
jgi:methylglutaconyl-CoA hydratase